MVMLWRRVSMARPTRNRVSLRSSCDLTMASSARRASSFDDKGTAGSSAMACLGRMAAPVVLARYLYLSSEHFIAGRGLRDNGGIMKRPRRVEGGASLK